MSMPGMSWSDGYGPEPVREPVPRDGYGPEPVRELGRTMGGPPARKPRAGGRNRGAAPARGQGAPPLLDKSLLPSPHALQVEGAPCLLLARLWPVFVQCRRRPLGLGWVTFTAPQGSDVRAAAVELAKSIRNPEGTLLVVERRRNAEGSEHLHGLSLVADEDALRRAWVELTGAHAYANAIKPITGWREHLEGSIYELTPNVIRTLQYAFKAARSLDDVYAAGTLAGPWAAARADVERTMARQCPGCGAPFPEAKRQDARWCSSRCKSAAGRARKRQRPEPEPEPWSR